MSQKKKRNPKENPQSINAFFQGRIGVLDYWIGMIISFVAFVILISSPISNYDFLTLLTLAFWVFYKFSFSVRRAHDLNKTGWIVLLEFVPIINIVIWFILSFFRGDSKKNKYGSKPKNINHSERLKNIFIPQ